MQLDGLAGARNVFEFKIGLRLFPTSEIGGKESSTSENPGFLVSRLRFPNGDAALYRTICKEGRYGDYLSNI